ncbi:hypothetical protein BJX70DRAFT_38092 [Aspergillus crustosus]
MLSRVELPCDDVDTIARVLSFCYLEDYSQRDNSANLVLEEIFRNHLGVYLAADKFSMIPLRELASSRIVEWAKLNWSLRCFPDTAQDIHFWSAERDWFCLVYCCKMDSSP